MPIHPLYIHTRYILLDQLSHVFFSRSPESSSRPNGSPRLVDFWQVNPANISEHERWRWDMWKKLLKGIPPCDFSSKWRRPGVGIWGTGVGRKLWGSWRGVEVKKHPTAMNELMPCVVWLACWKWWKTCESGKPCASLRGLFMKLSASSLSTFYVGMGGVQNARPNRDEWRFEEDF